MPPHIGAAPVFGMALYSAKALLAGRAGDVWGLVTENLESNCQKLVSGSRFCAVASRTAPPERRLLAIVKIPFKNARHR